MKNITKKTKIIILAIVGSIILLVAWGWWWSRQDRNQVGPTDFVGQLLSLPDGSKIRAQIGLREYTFEVVNTPASIKQGLSDREAIGSDGMLFVFPVKTYQSFWMPRMNFDLDILWLNDDKILQIMPQVPAEPISKALWQLPLYASEKPANVVLELPAGRAQLMEIKVGDQLKLINN